MKNVFPNYYKDFEYIADKCRHSCCAGWEIDIDDDTLGFYDTIEGDLAERLSKLISYDDEPHFILQEL